MSSRILVVDDEKGVRDSLGGILEDEGYEVTAVESGEKCLELIERQNFGAVLLDVWLPGISGLDVMKELAEMNDPPAAVMISGHGSIETAVKATKLGAFDFIEKPLSLEKTVLVVKNAIKQKELETQNIELREKFRKKTKIVGETQSIRELKEDIEKVAPSDGRVFIYGENGTGKELVARKIHLKSNRSEGPFIETNCAAIPEELIESELFGHVKGSFTGAVKDKEGKFKLADGGTLFLDEIGDMSLKTQAKVLRVLEEDRFEKVGGNEMIDVDVRVIAATNKDIKEQIEKGNFREDLYFRLNVIPLEIPPLRERIDDIPLLVDYFFEEFSGNSGVSKPDLTEGALRVLKEYHWPGNVRELRNIIERTVIMTDGDRITEDDIPLSLDKPSAAEPEEDKTLKEARDEYEKQFIIKKLKAFDGNISRTAENLDIERSSLYRKIESHGIDVDEI